MNILFAPGGRRVALINMFRRAGHHVLAIDSDPLAPSRAFVEKQILTAPWSDAGFPDQFSTAVQQHHIDLVIPTMDGMIDKLASLTGFRMLGPKSKTFSDLCYDKRLTHAFFRRCGVRVPRLVTQSTGESVFRRPIFGCSSQGAGVVTGLDLDAHYIYTEPRQGPEYTVDAYLDISGRVVCAVPRLRIEVRAGEVQKSRVELNAHIIGETNKVLQKCVPEHWGPMNIQGILTEEGFNFIEINPRFGGGSPLSHAAGADYPTYVESDFRGVTDYPPPKIRDGLIMTRYDSEVYLEL